MKDDVIRKFFSNNGKKGQAKLRKVLGEKKYREAKSKARKGKFKIK